MSKTRCGRKACYNKREAQERVVLKLANTGRGGYTYSCDRCGWWHITRGLTDEDKQWSKDFRAKRGLKP